MIICGYCETQNQKDKQSCMACGGSLVDEITRKVNVRQSIKPITNRINTNIGHKSNFYKFVETGTLKRSFESSVTKAIRQVIR